MKDKIDEIYEDIAGRIRNNPDLFTDNSKENLRILATIIQTVNIAKCTLSELELECHFGPGFLMHSLQENYKIPFGMCEKAKFIRISKGFKIECDKCDVKKSLGIKKLCNLDNKKNKVTDEVYYW